MAFNDWTKMPFDQAVQVNPSVPLRRGYVYPFVDMQTVDPNSRSVTLSEMREFKGGGSRFISGDTLMARITPCLENGKIARYMAADDETLGHGSTEFIVIRGREKVTDNGFAYYLTKWEGVHQFCISQMTGSSGRQRVPTIALSHCEVSVPPIKEQQAIAQILGALDDKIELNRRMNKTLEEMARAIFKSWFVDFDPVRAKAAGQIPQGLTPETAALFPDTFEDSELGEIPKCWRVLNFDDLVVAKQGKYIQDNEITTELTAENIYPVWGGNGIRGYTNQKMYSDNVVVLTCRGSNCGLINITDSASWISNIAFACEPKIGAAEFLYIYFKNCSFEDCISGSAQPQITYAILKTKRMPFPISFEVIVVYSRIVTPFFKRLTANNLESHNLALLRDSLLSKLISGEIRVADAERIVGRHI